MSRFKVNTFSIIMAGVPGVVAIGVVVVAEVSGISDSAVGGSGDRGLRDR